MNTNNLTEAQYHLRKILTLHGREFMLTNPWLWEVDRWKELVFALLVQISNAPEDRVRQVVEHMANLDLLEIFTLADLCRAEKCPDFGSRVAQQILEFLQENEFDQSKAERGLTAICQAALGLQQHYEGKVQRYLRSYGELMLQDLDRTFQFNTLNEKEVRQAFTYWFQNVLNMPISLVDKTMQQFCDDHGLTPDQLIAAADELDINLGLVDDILQFSAVTGQRNKSRVTKQSDLEG